MALAVAELIADVLRREGGYVDHPADRGGPTNYGITQATLARHLGRPVSAREVRALSLETAAEIYRTDYYTRPRIDTLPPAVRPVIFDSAVNHGPRRAIRFLQSVCSKAGFGELTIDGLVGPRTEAAATAAERAMGDWLIAALVEERRIFYHQLVARDSSQAVFLQGWLNRIAEFDIALERLAA